MDDNTRQEWFKRGFNHAMNNTSSVHNAIETVHGIAASNEYMRGYDDANRRKQMADAQNVLKGHGFPHNPLDTP